MVNFEQLINQHVIDEELSNYLSQFHLIKIKRSRVLTVNRPESDKLCLRLHIPQQTFVGDKVVLLVRIGLDNSHPLQTFQHLP